MEENDTNKYEGTIPQSIEASGNFLKNTNKRFVVIIAIVCSLTFLGYTLIEKFFDSECVQIK